MLLRYYLYDCCSYLSGEDHDQQFLICCSHGTDKSAQETTEVSPQKVSNHVILMWMFVKHPEAETNISPSKYNFMYT